MKRIWAERDFRGHGAGGLDEQRRTACACVRRLAGRRTAREAFGRVVCSLAVEARRGVEAETETGKQENRGRGRRPLKTREEDKGGERNWWCVENARSHDDVVVLAAARKRNFLEESLA